MKKKSKKRIMRGMKSALKCIAFLSLLLLLIVRTYEVLSWKDTLGDYLSSVDQLYATEDNMIDVVFTGSSHTYCGVAPSVIWNETGVAAFNMTTSGQDKDSTYHYLVELLKTQSPKVVFVEMWGLTFDTHLVEGNVHRNMMGMPLSENSIALIDDYVEDDVMNASYKLRWPVIHTRYKELDLYDFVEYDFSQYGKESDLLYNVVPVSMMPYEGVGELSKSNKKWLEDLYELSIEEDFELVLFLAPTSMNEKLYEQVNAAAEFAEEHDITFLDFNRLLDEVGLDFTVDFMDFTHVNGFGAEKVTKYLAEYISENYDLKDHRGDKAYKDWDDSYTRYIQVRDTAILKICHSFDVYIEQLKKMDNITCIISFEGGYHLTPDMTPELVSWMFGMSAKEFKEGGTYIYKDGELKKIMDNKSEEVYIQELSEYNTLKIQNMNIADPSNLNYGDVMINMQELVVANDGVNFIIYDDFRDMVIDTRSFY